MAEGASYARFPSIRDDAWNAPLYNAAYKHSGARTVNVTPGRRGQGRKVNLDAPDFRFF